MNKQQLIETVISEILKGVSTRIREIVREEVDIGHRRIRKQLLEEFRRNGHSQPVIAKSSISQKKTAIDTGDQTINSILEDISSNMEEDMMPEMKFTPEATIEDVSKQMVTETKTVDSSNKFYKPAEGEAYNFSPLTMDPAKIDWSQFVEKMDEKKLPGDKNE